MPTAISKSLRPYQEDLLDRVRQAFEDSGEAVMMTLATGGGKTAIAARWAEGLPGRRTLMCCASLEVVRQAHAEYKKWGVVANGAPPGVFAALEQSPAIKVIAAHRATCANRILKRREGSDAFGALIVDEAHHAADGKGQTSALVRHFRERGKPVLGITATCWRLSKKQGFSETWTDLVQGMEWGDLARQGYLAAIDLREISVGQQVLGGELNPMGEYTDRGIMEQNADNPIFTSGGLDWLAETARQPNSGMRSTICYAVGQEHALRISSLAQARGIRCGLLVSSDDVRGRAAETVESERAEAVRQFRRGDLDMLINVNMVTEGFDCPSSEAILCLRPTNSLALWLQICGRGSRKALGKDRVLILDAAGNTERHGSPLAQHVWSLEARAEEGDGGDAILRACIDEHGAGCGGYIYTALRVCPTCQRLQGKACAVCGKHRMWGKYPVAGLMCDHCLVARQISRERYGARQQYMRGCTLCFRILPFDSPSWKKTCGHCYADWLRLGGMRDGVCARCNKSSVGYAGKPAVLCAACRRTQMVAVNAPVRPGAVAMRPDDGPPAPVKQRKPRMQYTTAFPGYKR